jgi:hypothetical protein
VDGNVTVSGGGNNPDLKSSSKLTFVKDEGLSLMGNNSYEPFLRICLVLAAERIRYCIIILLLDLELLIPRAKI